jgi:hypothetical protein
MTALTNLIPDPTTKNLWQCRPAAALAVDLAAPPPAGGGMGGASFISGWMSSGTRIYGMVSMLDGRDHPFCYDYGTRQLLPISGVATANLPLSPQQTGPWTPPHLELIGAQIIVTHPGFTGTGGAYFGVIDVTDPFHPTWSATNTSPTPLFFPPTWVSNFNGRAYYLVNPPGGVQPAAYFSDELLPLQITNPSQILTFEDNEPLTVSAGLALNNQLGGIIQALMVFKGVSNIYQITGDFALGTLARNSLNVATGTLAPNSVQSSEKGLFFMSPEGIRVIDFQANVSDPLGADGVGVTTPFIFALTPSRVCAAFNAGIYRIQVQNGAVTVIPGPGKPAVNPQQEWWFDAVRTLWSGPHTTNTSLELPWQNSFFVTLQGAGAKIFKSDPVQSNVSSFVENGTPLTFNWQTAPLPDTDQMAEVAMVQTTLHMALAATKFHGPWSSGWSLGFGPETVDASSVVTVKAVDQRLFVLDTVQLWSLSDATIWGQFNWGQATWGGKPDPLFPRRLDWHFPIVFRRMFIAATGTSNRSIKIGRLHLRYQILNYLQQDYDLQPSSAGLFILDKSPLGGGDVLG